MKKNKRSPEGFPVSLLSNPVIFLGLNPYIVMLTGFAKCDCATIVVVAITTIERGQFRAIKSS